MEIHTLLNKDALHELQKYLIKPSYKRNIYILCLLFLLLSVCSLFLRAYFLAMITLISVIILYFELALISKQMIKKVMRQISETYGGTTVEGKIIFDDDDLKIFNQKTKGELCLSYSVMKTLVETKNYYALFTKEHQMTLIDKQQFTSQTKEQFLQLIDKKMPAIQKQIAK